MVFKPILKFEGLVFLFFQMKHVLFILKKILLVFALDGYQRSFGTLGRKLVSSFEFLVANVNIIVVQGLSKLFVSWR